MTTKKSPTGIKHARCSDHVPHPYAAGGWLCVHPVDGWRADDVVAFADHLAAVRAGHRAAGRIRPLVDVSIETGGHRWAQRATGPDGEPFIGPMLGECRWSDRIASCQLPAAQTAEREPVAPMVGSGAPIGRPPYQRSRDGYGSAPDVALIPPSRCDHSPACAGRTEPTYPPAPRKARKARAAAPIPEPVADPVADPIADPISHDRCWTYLHTAGGPRRCIGRPDYHEGAHEYEQAEPVAPADYAVAIDGVIVAEIEHHTFSPAVINRPSIAEPIRTDGEPVTAGWHGPTDQDGRAVNPADMPAARAMAAERAAALAALDDELARTGRLTNHPAEPVAEPEPVQDDGRPVCDRCGQTFRKSGTGYAWHRANRPDCGGHRPPTVAEPEPEPARATIVDYSRPMPAGFAIADPFGALAHPIGSAERPAMIGGIPFVAREPEPEPATLTRAVPDHPVYTAAVAERVAHPDRGGVYVNTADTAKLARTALERAYPGRRFYVRGNTYSGGSSIAVYWDDTAAGAPSRRDVDALLDVYGGRGFDGMTDSSYGIRAWLAPDGSATFASSSGTGSMAPEYGSQRHPAAVLVSFAPYSPHAVGSLPYDVTHPEEAAARKARHRARHPRRTASA